MQFQITNNPSVEANLKQLDSTSDLLDLVQGQPKINNLIINNKPNQKHFYRRNSQPNNYKTVDEIANELNTYKCCSQIINFAELQKSPNATIKKYKESLFFGEFFEGQRSGKGIMMYTNGRIYQGEWLENYKHGKGYEKFQNGAVYEGTYSKGKPEGYGKYHWDNGESYEGEWSDGMKNGSGIWRGPKGDSYIGQWKDGKATGYGVHTWINGDRYQGQFMNCLKHGQGIQKFANGDNYKGMYESGKPSGYGEYYWAMGSFFKGYFQNGLRNGNGVWKRGPGNTDKYEGQYKEDKKEGYGVFSWQNGNLYKGNFMNDQRHGYGEMYWNDGSFFKGEWEYGLQLGQIQSPQQEQPRIRITYSQKKQRQKVLQASEDEFYEERPFIYHQPKHPAIMEAQRKFRARGISSKKSTRIEQSSKTSRNYVTEGKSQKMKKYSSNTRHISYNKKMPYANNSQKKMMSSSFFLYKIHGKNSNEMLSTGVKGRMVKTSGGMRQKHISEQIKYFTRNKINPQGIEGI